MKIKYSLFSRRQFLNGLLGGSLGALVVSLFDPVIRFIFPPYKEPDQVILPWADFSDLAPNTVRNFPWGSKPGLLKKNDDGSLTAFVAVCTHLDCNVTYLKEERKFFCACHDGWYDETGVNIAGPPPSPLRTLEVAVEGEELIITRPGFKAEDNE
jgi:menaquinol-cytochrome c reductase iron-sulfur subunit